MEIELVAEDKVHEQLFNSVYLGLSETLSGRDWPIGQQIKKLQILRFLLLTLQGACDPERSKGVPLEKFAKAILDTACKM